MIHIHTKHAYLIGDALSAVPYMQHLCQKHGTEAVVTGEFNSFVRNGLGPTYRFTFADKAPDQVEASYTLCVADLFPQYSGICHMCQCYFRAAGDTEPALPVALDLRCEPSGLANGIVLSPFSVSDMGGNKLWPHDRWLEVCSQLRDRFGMDIYVLGSKDDDVSRYAKAGFEPVIDRPLAQVLDLMRNARLVLTIDNGLSHIAHYGSIGRHVLLYPGCFGEAWVRNPHAAVVRESSPSHITVDRMLQAAVDRAGKV